LTSNALLSPQDYISRTQTGDEANQPDVVNMLFAGGHSGTFQVLMLVLHVVSEWHQMPAGGSQVPIIFDYAEFAKANNPVTSGQDVTKTPQEDEERRVHFHE
jgi:hypothetical protein